MQTFIIDWIHGLRLKAVYLYLQSQRLKNVEPILPENLASLTEKDSLMNLSTFPIVAQSLVAADSVTTTR